jgi:hypothetical protein
MPRRSAKRRGAGCRRRRRIDPHQFNFPLSKVETQAFRRGFARQKVETHLDFGNLDRQVDREYLCMAAIGARAPIAKIAKEAGITCLVGDRQMKNGVTQPVGLLSLRRRPRSSSNAALENWKVIAQEVIAFGAAFVLSLAVSVAVVELTWRLI